MYQFVGNWVILSQEWTDSGFLTLTNANLSSERDKRTRIMENGT